jgi:hypothetical protein
MNKNKGAAMEAARQRKAERGQTRSYLFDWRVGTRLKDNAGALYEVVAVNQEDRVVSIQRLVLDAREQPIPGLRERALIRAVAGRDGVRLGGKWVMRVPAEGAA